MFVLGPLEDQLTFLILAKTSLASINVFPYSIFLKPFVDLFYSSEPVTFIIAYILKVLIGTNYLNVFILISLIFSLILSFIFFKRYKNGYLYSLIFVFSNYFWLHFSNHMALSQLWLLVCFYMLYEKYKNPLVLSVFLVFSVLVSNYLAFFLILVCILFFIIDNLIFYLKNKYFDKRMLLVFILTLGITSISSFFLMHRSIKYRNSLDYGSSQVLPVRSIDDFFYFSSRPWYFLIPSPKHAFYGEFSSNVLSKIESTGNFLADDYFPGEHGASFFGYFLLLTFFGVSGYIVFKGSMEQKIYLSKYWLINIGLFLLMMPPYFTISGLKIYTPGYLVYEFFPMFRTTVRMSVLILLNILIVLAIFFNDLYLSFSADLKKKAYLTGFMFLLTGITLFETFIPIKIQYLNNPPEVYSYIGDTYSGSNFIVYPYSRANEAVFWIDAHKSYLVNPRMYSKGSYDAELFTKSLNTIDGIKLLSNTLGNDLPVEKIDYFVVFKNITEEEKTLFLNSSNFIVLEKEFEDSYLFRILN